MTIKQRRDDYNDLRDAYNYIQLSNGYSRCVLPFTFKEYLATPENCSELSKSVGIYPVDITTNN